jgi:hypothetical protein
MKLTKNIAHMTPAKIREKLDSLQAALSVL